MSGNRSNKLQKVMVQPINLIFRFLQSVCAVDFYFNFSQSIVQL